MALSLSGAMTTALGANFSQPGLFLQLGFSSPLYYCDRAAGTTRAWNSLTWTAADFEVADYSLEHGIVQKLSLQFVDLFVDFTFAELLDLTLQFGADGDVDRGGLRLGHGGDGERRGQRGEEGEFTHRVLSPCPVGMKMILPARFR